MNLASDKNDFWDRVDREMRMKNPTLWRMASFLLRLGILVVLLTAAQMVLVATFTQAQGYFLFPQEQLVNPIYSALVGLGFIFFGAFLRFRAMGPIIERLKRQGNVT